MILVTGATGLVGGHLLWHLLQENERIIAIRRKTSNLEPLKCIFRFYSQESDKYINNIEWRIADVSDKTSLKSAIDGVTEIYHCAAVVSLGSKPGNIQEINVQGTKNVVEIATEAGVRKLCFVSSIAACGTNADGAPADEKSVWDDNDGRSPYSRSKYYSEQEVWKAIRKGLNAVIVNPGVILGYSGTSTGSSQLFSIVRKGLPFYIDGGSGYVCVEDVVTAMILLMKSKVSGERYILVEGNYTNKQILDCIARGFGKTKPLLKISESAIKATGAILETMGKLFGFAPPLDRNMARSATNRAYYSSGKIISELGFKFTPIEKCIEQTCRFMKK